MPIFLYQDYEKLSSLPFYSQQHVSIIDSKDQILEFGQKTSQAKGWFLTMPDFLQKAKSESVFVAVKMDKLDEFQGITKSLNFCTILRNANAVLLSNSPDDCKIAAQQTKDESFWQNVEKKAKSNQRVIYVPSTYS